MQRRAFANALWLSTALTGLATPRRTRYTRLSPDIWKRFSLDSANATGTSPALSSPNSVRSSIVEFWREVSFASIAVRAAWIAWLGSAANGGVSATPVAVDGWQIPQRI